VSADPREDPGVSEFWLAALVHQFAAAIEALERAIRACPEHVWDDASLPIAQRFWYLAYHTLFWLDYYMAPNERDFRPPAPYTMGEMDPAGAYPDVVYTSQQLLGYLDHGRRRCAARLGPLTETEAAQPCGFERRDMSVLELFLYNMRHVQHHAAQLNLILRQRNAPVPGWVGQGRLSGGGA